MPGPVSALEGANYLRAQAVVHVRAPGQALRV